MNNKEKYQLFKIANTAPRIYQQAEQDAMDWINETEGKIPFEEWQQSRKKQPIDRAVEG